MKRLWNHGIVKNSRGQVRSGWILLLVTAVYFGIRQMTPEAVTGLLRILFIATGQLNPTTGQTSDLAVWWNNVGLPVTFQMVTEAFLIVIPLLAWKFLMKNPIAQLGFRRGAAGRREGLTGMAAGAVSATVVFVILITAGGGQVVSWSPRFSLLIFLWILAFVLVAFGEETFTCGFFMSVLRRTESPLCIMLIPSAIFGVLHLVNPNVSFFSLLNILLIGLLFSYMYYKSGNLWMCIGYHFTWNVFQGCVYGINVSGMEIPGILTTQFPQGTILNGGLFGMEGSLPTTVVTLLGLLFVRFYYRNSACDFIGDSLKERL